MLYSEHWLFTTNHSQNHSKYSFNGLSVCVSFCSFLANMAMIKEFVDVEFRSPDSPARPLVFSSSSQLLSCSEPSVYPSSQPKSPISPKLSLPEEVKDVFLKTPMTKYVAPKGVSQQIMVNERWWWMREKDLLVRWLKLTNNLFFLAWLLGKFNQEWRWFRWFWCWIRGKLHFVFILVHINAAYSYCTSWHQVLNIEPTCMSFFSFTSILFFFIL